jgi:hypothetical protein
MSAGPIWLTLPVAAKGACVLWNHGNMSEAIGMPDTTQEGTWPLWEHVQGTLVAIVTLFHC